MRSPMSCLTLSLRSEHALYLSLFITNGGGWNLQTR